MTSYHDSDAFERRFEEATNTMHRRTERGDGPSPHLWQTIRSQLGTTSQAETADPRAIGPDRVVDMSTFERNETMDAALSPVTGGNSRTQRHQVGWMAVLAAGLVGIMIVTSVWLNGGSPSSGDRTDLAWAPGMGTAESSPVASSMCQVEPLTADEAVEIVLNPGVRYRELGDDRFSDSSDTVWDASDRTVVGELSREGYRRDGNDNLTESAALAADKFAYCLNTGSLLQVYALLDPIAVQQDVISRFPVVRSEADIRNFILKWGDQPFLADGAGIITRFDAYSKPGTSDKWISATDPNGGIDDLVIVPMYYPSSPLPVAELLLQEYPDGTWLVVRWDTMNALG